MKVWVLVDETLHEEFVEGVYSTIENAKAAVPIDERLGAEWRDYNNDDDDVDDEPLKSRITIPVVSISGADYRIDEYEIDK